MNQLILSKGKDLSSGLNRERVKDILAVRLNSDNVGICIRQDRALIGYKYEISAGTWSQYWKNTVFSQPGNYPLDLYPWLISDKLLPDRTAILLNHPDGIRLYALDVTEPALELVNTDGNFHEVYSFTQLWGKFYSNGDWVGVMTKNMRNGEVKFYAATSDSFNTDEPDPLFVMDVSDLPIPAWSSISTNYFVTKLCRDGPEVIGQRTSQGLDFYRFNDDDLLERVINTSHIPKLIHGSTRDHLFFADLTHKTYQDILHLNDSGLFTYTYNDNIKDYSFLHRHTEFTKPYGWSPECSTSIRIIDLNRDGRDDLLYTGPRGLTALSFDSAEKTWKTLLNPEHISGSRRYATVVGTLPAVPPAILQPSIFTQDQDGRVQWSEITKAPLTATSSTTSKPPSSSVVTAPRYPDLHEMPPKYIPRDISLPKQTSRKSLREKPILRWSERWDGHFLKEAVDPGSGHVQLSVPLVDISPGIGLGLQLTLSYSSQVAESDLVGVGWILPLAQDYIIVDYGKSIYPKDAQYYLVLQGYPRRLESIANESDVVKFRLAEQKDEQIQIQSIEYHQSKERWVMEGPTEQAFYGRAVRTMAEDALQWSLSWPNWRGIGRDKGHLQPSITAWYLNARMDKNERTLYYYYDKDQAAVEPGKVYDSALRLRSISDGQDTRLVFEYCSKSSTEYTSSNPIDEDGNVVFPLSLTQSHYLQGYSLTTAAYRQTLKFLYHINKGKRLLTDIKQQFLSYDEALLQLSYQTVLDKPVLSRCRLVPRESAVEFQYKSLIPPLSLVNNGIQRYPIRGTPKIAYGSDFTIMASLDARYGQVLIQIMNREMSRITVECSELTFECPSIRSQIKDYTLQSHRDAFSVVVDGGKERVLHTYSRHEGIWSQDFATSFSEEALMRLGETVIALAEQRENNLKIFHRPDVNSEWKTTSFIMPRAIKLLALHNHVIVSYDDIELSVFHKSDQSGWEKKILRPGIEVTSDTSRQTVASFDITPELKHQLMTALEQNGLQIYSNLVSISALRERNGQLSSVVHLFLLDANYDVATKETFEIQRENLYHISRESKSNNGGTIYHLGYMKEDGVFKVRVKNVTGKDIEGIRNKNRRKDAIEDLKKRSNEDGEFQKSTKGYFFINFNLYLVQASQLGVYCSNDTLLRNTGNGWERESLPVRGVQTIPLGEHFVLESENELLFKLYKQGSDKKKQGQSLRELHLHSPGQLLNRFPAYIAYHQTSHTIEILTFKDDQLAEVRKYSNSQILPESDWRNIVTLTFSDKKNESTPELRECLIRPVPISPKPRLFVSQMKLTDGAVQRLTGYERSISSIADESYSETITLIPGNDKKLFGWYEITRSYQSGNVSTTEYYFDASGQEVIKPPDEESADSPPSEINSKSSPSVLLDRSGKWLISDFSPYRIEDETVGYYGFESYESDRIGSANADPAKTWVVNQAEIVGGRFAFTGDHYLRLNSSQSNSFIEGVFQPRDQSTTYLAACWIRSSEEWEVGTPAPHLRAIVSTGVTKIIGLQAQIKNQLGDWLYLELPLDFQSIRQIYENYINYGMKDDRVIAALPTPKDAEFRITLRVEAPPEEVVDLDHIRFAPMAHDFQATVYHPLTGNPLVVIQTNGLVTRNVYNCLHQKVSDIQEDGTLTRFTSSSRTGKLMPGPIGNLVNSKPGVLTLELENGSYETFDEYALRNRWQIDGNSAAWNTAPGQLWHRLSKINQIRANKDLFDSTNAAMRCYFALQESQAFLSLNWKGIGTLKLTRQTDHSTNLILPHGLSVNRLPSEGELIVVLEKQFLWLWFDGVLLFDQQLPVSADASTPWSNFTLEAKGDVLIEDCLVMNRPLIKVEYYNGFGDKAQVILLEDAQTAQVSETLYDELGRESITTKTTRIKRNPHQSILAYRSEFVSNKNPASSKSVWQTGKLLGEVAQLNDADQGFSYTRTEFNRNPLSQEKSIGLPGVDYSTSGSYATKISYHSDVPFVDNLFPLSQGYRQRVEHTPNGSLRIAVFDRRNNQVAKYVRVPSYDHLLSTYEYDKENRLVKILPPLYHEKVDTARRVTPWQAGEKHLSPNEERLQNVLATRFTYDEAGHLIRKTTPDSGTTEYLYNSAGQKRFMVSLNAVNQPQEIVYFNYDANNQLITSGHLNRTLPLSYLNLFVESNYQPDAKPYQQFDYADDHIEPLLRGRVKHCVTFNPGDPIAEKVLFNGQGRIVAKSAVTLSGGAEADQLADLKKVYSNDRLSTLIYPINVDGEPLGLLHSYNRLGQLIGLGTKGNPTQYASFTYRATGELASEQYHPFTTNSFNRSFHYNSPGFLERISDPFLTEEIAYTGKGYGHVGYGDGMVVQTAFNASWPADADQRWFSVDHDGREADFSTCTEALKRSGYLSNFNEPIKLFIRKAETDLPLVCGGGTGQYLAKLIAQRQKPTYYGHRYSYGNHQELVKAKYFTHDEDIAVEPLQQDSFSKGIPNLSIQQSRHIWRLLTEARYVLADQQRNDPATAIGKRGKSFFRIRELHEDLSKLNGNNIIYAESIERLVISAISEQRTLSITDFETAFLHWQGLDRSAPRPRLVYNWQLDRARVIGRMLLDKSYLPTQSADFAALDNNFLTLLHQYKAFIPQLVQTLSQHFAYELGQTAFDVESYKIDANGNHRLFYTGFDRYELDYRETANQVDKIKIRDYMGSASVQVFSVKHDARGNVIQALHKNIQLIEYHPVSQLATRVQLTDGRSLRFYYDAQGERVLKRVFDSAGDMTLETRYLRDEKGRVLVDRQTKYLDGSVRTITTAYLYGPRGLLGFFRDNSFYSVTTDHAGSVRLVIKDGRVVAAYDYLPYGQLMRSYGDDPHAQIMYRYTGQELDEETGLYNYHARLYDPSIGRFYQPDPKAQYFSPYKYAGNSPISTVDPDGEFAFLITCLVLAAIGAYLGGAAANNRWDPTEWDWSDPSTGLGMVGGAIAGGLLPVGFAASVTTIGVAGTVGLGFAGAYITTAASTGEWSPLMWKWDRPETLNAIFQGFGSGSGIAGGIGLAHSFAKSGKALTSLSKLLNINRNAMKTIFLTVSYSAGGGVAYAGGVMANDGKFAFWQWDYTNPGTWSALTDGFDVGMGWPQNFIEVSRGIVKVLKNPKKLGSLLDKSPSSRQTVKAILKNPQHPLYKVATSAIMAFVMGSSANNEVDVTRWNMASFSTYQGILNGVFFGKDTTNMVKFAFSSKIKPTDGSLTYTVSPKAIAKKWMKQFSRMLDDIHVFRERAHYERLVEQSFSSAKTWLSKFDQLTNKPSLRRDIESFLKMGVEKWKRGLTRVPDALKRLISDEARKTVQETSRQLIEWESEAGEQSKKQKEVYPDEEVDFLSCQSLKRRKRANKRSRVTCSTTSDVLEIRGETIKHFFEDGIVTKGEPQSDGYIRIRPKSEDNHESNKYAFDRNSPRNLAEKLSLFSEMTPNTLASTKKDFFPNAILGSLLTMPKTGLPVRNVYAKVETVKVPNTFNTYETPHSILKTFFKKDDGTVVFRTFIAEERVLISKVANSVKEKYHTHYRKELGDQSHYSKTELDEVKKQLGLENFSKIEETIYYFNTDNTLSLRSSSVQADEYLVKPEPAGSKASEGGTFHNVLEDSPQHTTIQTSIEKLSDTDLTKVEEGTTEIYKALLTIYNENRNIFRFKPSESGFHGFSYGSLSLNFGKELDIKVESVAGRGYADLIMISRKLDSIGQAVPVVVEFKVGKTSSDSAIAQITDNGYVNSWFVNIKTISKQAVLLGVNSDPKVTDTATSITRIDIPQYEGLIHQLGIELGSSNEKNIGKLKEVITKNLKQMYFSISPSSFKRGAGNNQYHSHVVLGELLARGDVYVHSKQDGLSTFIYQQSGQLIMMNVIESSKPIKNKNGNVDYYEFKDLDIDKEIIKLPDDLKHFHNMVKVDIKLNSKSKNKQSSFPSETVGSAVIDKKGYFQGVDVTLNVETGKFTKGGDYQHAKQLNPDAIEVFQNEFKGLERLKNFINSESDFQAVVQGLLTKTPEVRDGVRVTTKVFPEINPARDGRIDLLVFSVKENGDSSTLEGITVAELKYAAEEQLVAKLSEEAEDQMKKYMDNFKFCVGPEKVNAFASVFVKSSGLVKSSSVDHGSFTSDASSSGVPKLKKRTGRSLDGEDNLESVLGAYNNGLMGTPLLVPSVERKEPFHSEEIEKLGSGSQIGITSAASSGAGSLRFWPVSLAKTMGVAISSFLTNSRMADKMKTVNNKSIPKQDFPLELLARQPSFSKTGPTLLDMGDQWLQKADMNGILTWGILLVRKWSGCKLPTSEISGFDSGKSVELDVRSSELVDAFFESLLDHAETFGIRSNVSAIIDTLESYSGTMRLVRARLSEGRSETIPKALYRQLIDRNISEITRELSQSRASDFLSEVNNSLSELQHMFCRQEREWSGHGEHCTEMAQNPPNRNKIRTTEVISMSQGIPSVSTGLNCCNENTVKFLENYMR